MPWPRLAAERCAPERKEALAVRSPRLDLRVPLELRTDGGILHGSCINISESGLLASFAQAPELWITADLCLYCGQKSHVLPARVARLDGDNAGLTFCFRHEQDREAVRSLLDFATGTTKLAGGLPPF